MGWEPEPNEWDNFKEKEDAQTRAKLVEQIKSQFGFQKGDTMIVQSRTGNNRVLKPDHLIENIIKAVQGGLK